MNRAVPRKAQEDHVVELAALLQIFLADVVSRDHAASASRAEIGARAVKIGPLESRHVLLHELLKR